MDSQEIQQRLQDAMQSGDVSHLSASFLEEALSDASLSTRGLLFSAMFRFWNSVGQQIGSERAITFALDYLRERMLAEDSADCDEDIDWHRPYEAAWEGASLLGALWFRESPNLDRERVAYRNWLKRLVLDANPDQRLLISNGLLEALFRDRRVAKFFKSWKDEPALNDVSTGV